MIACNKHMLHNLLRCSLAERIAGNFMSRKALAAMSLSSGFLIVLVSGAGCLPEPYSVGEPDSLFSEYVLVWDLVDQYYACFCQSAVDWDQVYSAYKPLAHGAGNRDQLMGIIVDMLGNLQDMHLSLTDSAGILIETWNPDYFANWNLDVWQSYMSQWGLSPVMGPFGISALAPPLDSIGYFYVSTLGDEYSWSSFFNESYAIQDCSGLLIDLRMCSGSGMEVNAFYSMGRLASSGEVGYLKAYRIGPGRCDMGELQRVYATKNGAWQFTGPTIVLTGRDTQGAAELFTLLLTTQDHVTVIGDTTGGYANLPESYNLLYDWTISIPDMVPYTPDTIPVLRNGLAPDVYVQATEADFQAGVDPVLEAALEMLL